MEPTWFGLGDRDVATHLVRTQMLDAGYPLSAGHRGPVPTLGLPRSWGRVRLLPMTDDRVETHIAVADPDSPSGRRVVHFQEYWIRLRAEVPAEAVVVVGIDDATPAPGVIDAITDADLVVLPPSNPVVSVGTILGVPRVREAIVATSAPVVGLSPIIGGAHVRGMAEQMLTSIGVEVSAAGVGLHYGARSAGGVLDGWLVDSQDADDLDRLHEAGPRGRGRPAADDRRRGHRGDGRRGDRPGPYAVTRRTVSVVAPDGVPEVRPGDDLVALLLPLVDLEDGDVVVVTSKVVSKAEGRLVPGDDRDGARSRTRPSGSSPGAGRPRSSGPATA